MAALEVWITCFPCKMASVGNRVSCMKTPQTLFAGAVSVLCVILWFNVQADPEVPAGSESREASPQRIQWEHLALPRDASKPFAEPDFSRKINQIGDQGWELVNVLNFAREGTTTRTVYYFKRLKQ